MAAVALDMLFGGRKGLGAIPSLDSATEGAVVFLRKRLEKGGRSRRTHFWRGVVSAIVLIGTFGLIGWLINGIADSHAAIAAVAAAVLARFVALKTTWRTVQNDAASSDPAVRRRGVERAIETFASYYIPALLLFLLGGFALLVPFHCLHIAVRIGASEEGDSAFLRPFIRTRNIVAAPGDILASLFVALAILLWPATDGKSTLRAIARPGFTVRHWSSMLLAHSLGLSLKVVSRDASVTWVGPASGTAKIDTADGQNALIVALLAFGLCLAFLLILLLASVLG